MAIPSIPAGSTASTRTIFDDAPSASAPAAAAANASAAATAILTSDAKMTAATTTEEWRWTFSTTSSSANADASPSEEADTKAGAAADLSIINQRIAAVVQNIRSLFLAGINPRTWNLQQIKSNVMALLELFKQQHQLEKSKIKCSCCGTDCDIALSIIKQINWFQGQAERSPTTNDLSARVYKKGLQLHFKRLLGRIELTFRNLEKNNKLEADNKEFYSHFFPEFSPHNNLEELLNNIFNAAVELRYERLEVLLNMFGKRLIPFDDEVQLFKYVISYFCTLPELQPKHFQILDLLINAGYNFRGTDQGLGYRNRPACYSTYHLCLYKNRGAAAIQLIHYLYNKGLDPNEDHYTWVGSVRNFLKNQDHYPNRIMQALLELGLDLREEWISDPEQNPVLNVLDQKMGYLPRIRLACSMIGAGTMDIQIKDPAAKEAFLKRCESLVGADVQLIVRTMDLRLQFLERRDPRSGCVREGLAPSSIDKDAAGIVVDFARKSDSEIAAAIWSEVFPS